MMPVSFNFLKKNDNSIKELLKEQHCKNNYKYNTTAQSKKKKQNKKNLLKGRKCTKLIL